MTELAGTVLDWQRQAPAAHRASPTAVEQGFGAAEQPMRPREAGQAALEANLDTWQGWSGPRGWK